MDTKIVYGMLIGDGALVGVSTHPDAKWKSYWYGIEGEDWCIVQFTLPEDADVDDIAGNGDMYTDAHCLRNNCIEWVVIRCGERPYMTPYFVFVDGSWHFANFDGSYFVFVDGSWHFANFDGSVGIEYRTPGEDGNTDSDDDDFEDDEY